MLKNVAPRPGTSSVKKARSLRRTMSLPEVLLWQHLRQRPNGLKFRKQHPTGPYILDFYCSDARLAVEIDGEWHARGTRPERDAARDDWLLQAGIATLRLPAADTLRDLDAALRAIIHAAASRLPLHHAAHGPPPRDELGED